MVMVKCPYCKEYEGLKVGFQTIYCPNCDKDLELDDLFLQEIDESQCVINE